MLKFAELESTGMVTIEGIEMMKFAVACKRCRMFKCRYIKEALKTRILAPFLGPCPQRDYFRFKHNYGFKDKVRFKLKR